MVPELLPLGVRMEEPMFVRARVMVLSGRGLFLVGAFSCGLPVGYAPKGGMVYTL